MNKKNRVNSTCDRYDLIEKKCYSTKFNWPYEYAYYNASIKKVVTNEEGTLAVILISNNFGTKMVLFTEDRGFERSTCCQKELPTLSHGSVFTSIRPIFYELEKDSSSLIIDTF